MLLVLNSLCACCLPQTAGSLQQRAYSQVQTKKSWLYAQCPPSPIDASFFFSKNPSALQTSHCSHKKPKAANWFIFSENSHSDLGICHSPRLDGNKLFEASWIWAFKGFESLPDILNVLEPCLREDQDKVEILSLALLKICGRPLPVQ